MAADVGDERTCRAWFAVATERGLLEVQSPDLWLPLERLVASTERAGWLLRSQNFPHGALLLTGTGIVPDESFTLLADDRIRIEVTSSNFPRFDRNLNTGGNNFDESKGVVAKNAVHHSKQYPSAVTLSVVKR
jgi:hypothetical protein